MTLILVAPAASSQLWQSTQCVELLIIGFEVPVLQIAESASQQTLARVAHMAPDWATSKSYPTMNVPVFGAC